MKRGIQQAPLKQIEFKFNNNLFFSNIKFTNYNTDNCGPPLEKQIGDGKGL